MALIEALPVAADQFHLDLGTAEPWRHGLAPRSLSAGFAAAEKNPGGPLIAVIDDDDGARLSTAWFLEGEGYRVLPFASGDAFLAAWLPERLACALLDMRMPGRNGLDVLRVLKEREDAPPVLVVTGHADMAVAVAAMKLKALDVIQKPYQGKALLDAIGEASASREAARAAQAPAREACALIEALSQRQRQVLEGIVSGQPNKIIAWKLGLSVRTVEAYRAQLFQKLRVQSTAEAVRIAVAAGMGGGVARAA